MANPLHADFYADQAVQRTATIIDNQKMAEGTFRVRFKCPEMAKVALPGQFLMLRINDRNDPLIGRPLAFYDILPDESGEPSLIDVMYIVKGNLTSRLVDCQPGEKVDIWGPLGNGFEPIDTDHLVMVAGGIGQTPFLCLAKEYLGTQSFGRELASASKITFCYGARRNDLLAGVEDFEALGIDVRLCTDDGSTGHHGLVTDLLTQVINERPDGSTMQVVCCGPEPMMEAVATVSSQHDIPCRVSLETPMACGIGICFSCVTKVQMDDGDWDFKRTCVDGPVFCAEKIVWH